MRMPAARLLLHLMYLGMIDDLMSIFIHLFFYGKIINNIYKERKRK